MEPKSLGFRRRVSFSCKSPTHAQALLEVKEGLGQTLGQHPPKSSHFRGLLGLLEGLMRSQSSTASTHRPLSGSFLWFIFRIL